MIVNNTHEYIEYENMMYWSNGDTRNFYMGDQHVVTDYGYTTNHSVTFQFIGTRFKFQCQTYKTRNHNVDVYDNGVKIGTYDSPNQTSSGAQVIYESPILEDKLHVIKFEKIYNGDNGYIMLPGIDITGTIVPVPNTKQIIKDNGICKYLNETKDDFIDLPNNEISNDNMNLYGSMYLSDILNCLKQKNMNDAKLMQRYNEPNNIKREQNINNILKIKSINLNNFENIKYIRSFINNLSIDNIRLFFKKQNNYLSIKNKKIINIDIKNISNINDLLTIYEFNNLNNDDILGLCDNQMLNIYGYFINDSKINNISLKGDYKGNYQNYLPQQGFINLYNNEINIKLFENQNYRITINKL